MTLKIQFQMKTIHIKSHNWLMQSQTCPYRLLSPHIEVNRGSWVPALQGPG